MVKNPPSIKNLPAMWETWVWSQGWEDPLEESMATQRIPWTEEPGGLNGVHGVTVRHEWVTKHSTAQWGLINLFQRRVYFLKDVYWPERDSHIEENQEHRYVLVLSGYWTDPVAQLCWLKHESEAKILSLLLWSSFLRMKTKILYATNSLLSRLRGFYFVSN